LTSGEQGVKALFPGRSRAWTYKQSQRRSILFRRDTRDLKIMNTRKLLIATLGLTVLLGGVSSALADVPTRNSTPAIHAERKAPEARTLKAKAGPRRVAEHRRVVKRAVHGVKFAHAKAVRKGEKTTHRVG
jgi:hypothetical protein